ncbi:hypothetical protein [Bradyrhizobium sp.]|uniref:hypothetical protein n=1 Tax=Bradyrhizobium sp. TaxID=376 RepID=UPI002733B088|nr:hypothetical protein [Bradyrhizobium sp.]MDP3078692.1 hypothetical protein [Bradyrhizobium sp.]
MPIETLDVLTGEPKYREERHRKKINEIIADLNSQPAGGTGLQFGGLNASSVIGSMTQLGGLDASS